MSSSSTECVDASVVVRYVSSAGPTAVGRLWERWRQDRPRLVAPSLLGYEVVNALHRAVRLDAMTEAVAARALAASRQLPIETYSDPELHQQAFALATRLELPATYDAHYLALAARFGAVLWTTDVRLAKRVDGGGPQVRLVE